MRVKKMDRASRSGLVGYNTELFHSHQYLLVILPRFLRRSRCWETVSSQHHYIANYDADC